MGANSNRGTADILTGMTAPESRRQQAGKVSSCLSHDSLGTGVKVNRPRISNGRIINSRGWQRPTGLLSNGRVSGHHKPEKLLFGPELGSPLFSLRSLLQLLTSNSFLLGDGWGTIENTEARQMWSCHQVTKFLNFQVHQVHRLR